ncbi:hypothetical protein NGA_0194900 [Nannochloropsis gaditana CCMP526]|uniref:uncharacterized protein n=1 Tax=Nannochloropsis gaditana (strain CCMP526) TaxID=1093141 RepID=UPI00029F75CD|nr:hypothetical protein NGA_0194900 [Nannochloropsis gaditana CCMP526]EKU21885.1 hypothetical protein NGA_0194900 [Nannochloropsis gaditana CCMP526]|eukprot:XP_005854477.1 hypothetical protein NGA_0194900 [Nannochloropsis gaditana CCMP526]
MLPTSILCLSAFALSLVLEPFPGSTTHAFLVPRPFISPTNGIRPTRLPITAPRETKQDKRGPWGPRLFVRRKSEREERDEEEEYGDEEEEYQDEVARIVGVGREGRPVRRNKNVFLEWLRDVYQRIFWFGLEGLDDDDDDYYLDEIDWLGEWNRPQDVGQGWRAAAEEDIERARTEGGGGVFRGAFPFDRQTYPQQFDAERRGKREGGGKGERDGREAILRKTGEREEPAVWSNVGRGKKGRTGGGIGGRKGKVEEEREKESFASDMARLEEREESLMVSREVWRRRIADVLRAGEGIDTGRLSKARARLQMVDRELEQIDRERRALNGLQARERGRMEEGWGDEEDEEEVVAEGGREERGQSKAL